MAAPAVAKVSFVAADILIELRPSPPSPSKYTSHWQDLQANCVQGSPAGVKSLPNEASIAPTLQASKPNELVIVLAECNASLVARLISPLSSFSSKSLVINLGVEDDLSDALLLKSSVGYVLHSKTAQQAHDNALLAARLAHHTVQPVLHLFYFSESRSGTVVEVEPDRIHAYTRNGSVSTPTINGNGMPNGVNGTNGYTDGHANGHTIERPNGSSSSSSSGLSTPVSSRETADKHFKAYLDASLHAVALLRRAIRPLTQSGPSHARTLVFCLGSVFLPTNLDDVSIVDVNLLAPLSASQILSLIRSSVKEVIVLEQAPNQSLKWSPFYLDVALALQEINAEKRPKLRRGIIENSVSSSIITSSDFAAALSKQASSSTFTLGFSIPKPGPQPLLPHVPSHEASYTKLLSHVFGDRLEVSNAPELVSTVGKLATNPEFALGRVHSEGAQKEELVNLIRSLLQDDRLPKDFHTLLSQWLLSCDGSRRWALAQEIVQAINDEKPSNPQFSRLRALQKQLFTHSRWIIGSDAWSYDIGSSGLHHAITSGLNVNLLIIDNQPYSTRAAADPEKRKKDIGLYALNYGNVYVASVAVYASYGQVLQALAEADEYPGTSVVLAYLPYESEDVSALSILKESKNAIDSGYWPLYRWNPSNEASGKDALSLDSEVIKADLQEFIDRQNHISQLVGSKPQLAGNLIDGMGKILHDSRRKKVLDSYDKLLNSMEGPPLLVLYASDGGAAEKIAKRLGRRAKARGLSSRVQTMDSYSLKDLAEQDEHVVFVTSTAGQGEPPQNGRDTFKAFNAAISRGEALFTNLKYSVFAMGDSHYWPRAEDARYYNRPGKELNQKLEVLGGTRIADIGLGDDQDSDGPDTGYKIWEPLLWKALGVGDIQITEAEPEPITNEHIKIASNFLRGTIAEGLQDTSTGALAPSDGQLTKFHGIYEQDDRDIRDERKDSGLEPAYAFMIRCRLPGGVCTPAQWLAMSQIADEHGNGTFKMTTRQTFQFHGVIKRHLKPAIQDINRALMDTIAACGDVNRNVLCSSLPELSHLHSQAYHFAKRLSEKLLPKTTAYHEIWLDKKQVAGDAIKDAEPMYGAYYLPRKFKIAVAIPPNNDVDVFANDVGFIAIPDVAGNLLGFNVTAGGGMGVTHSNKKTYPRTGSLLGFCTEEQAYEVAKQILLTQRDSGNRVDRKNARLKYTIDRMGLEVFKAEVESRLGYKLDEPRPFTFDRNIDDFGWLQSADGKWNFTMFIENGRVADEPGKPFKSALQEIAKEHKGTFRLTANQHLILAEVAPDDLELMKSLLAKHHLDNTDFSGLRLSSSACVAFPTCGLAMAESERYLPILIDKVEKICEENGLRHDSIVMRMTGCPNGCARPYLAEVALVGKSPGAYLMLLGGGYYGQRLNKIYRENVTEPEILAILGPMIKHYALERLAGERFGDFVIRVGYISSTTSGKEWYVGMGGEGEYKEVAS